ncbi:hypothetical protein [Streptomyces clavuligerus]|uniref:hypothetical protein n=1 Tax=Streptomyces clavuligerus TaxID=1901 RepID=UPI0001851760|nr:hypothetical protein [Streptomyces clavuligerus]WDN52475.1 hypothetical protein LL058_11805 [Streptomyces clavuligerus]
MCREAGLPLSVNPSTEDPARRVDLGTIDEDIVLQLTDLLRRSMKRAYETRDRMRRALAAHGLDAPDLGLADGEIVLGNLTVAAADRLAQLLGAPPRPPRPDRDLDDWPEAQKTVARLQGAFREATGGGFLDLLFLSDCLRCGGEPVVSTGPIPLKSARRLVSALEFGGDR